MAKIFVDTSFLITFADPSRDCNEVAVDYFRECVSKGHILFISTIVAAEFEVGQPVSELPLSNFQICPFNLTHAVKSASFHKMIKGAEVEDSASRTVVRNDLKILAQAEMEEAALILTEDANTMSRWCEKLTSLGSLAVKPILLREGFHPDALDDPEARNLL